MESQDQVEDWTSDPELPSPTKEVSELHMPGILQSFTQENLVKLAMSREELRPPGLHSSVISEDVKALDL